MSESDRWARLDQLLDGALDQPPESRREWLERESGGDDVLRAEVERLLELAVTEDDHISSSGAMAGPLWQDVAAYLEGAEGTHRLGPGDSVDSYEILELIGTGGMGAVYRARDPNLHRDVAIKVLSHAYRRDASFLRRFEREAKLLASLNHPNIGAIYDQIVVDEQPYLVLELVDGPTLADRLDEGPMELPEIVSVACQIADALEEAHGKGIVHRDLKPGNVKLGQGGRVKVLDFGVAKTTLSPEEASQQRSRGAKAPTTATGVILGTASYMSPEQARGQPVDRRTDIWAFGCILYEMLAGKRAFGGTTTSDVLASVLRDEVDWHAIPATTPAPLSRLVQRCLEKEPRQRLQHIGDARIELEEVRHGISGPRRVLEPRPPGPRTSWTRARLLLAGLGIGLAMAVLFFRSQAGDAGPPAVTRTEVVIGPEERLWVGLSPSLALSPDGRMLAFVAGSGGQSRLYIRRLDAFEPDLVRASEGARNPFFSADGQWLAFFAGGAIRKVSTSGGNPELVAEVGLQPRGATWTAADQIVFGEAGASGLFAVGVGGGEPRPVTKTASEHVAHLWPHAVGEEAILFTIREENEDGTRESVAVLTLADGTVRELRPGTQAAYVASGHLVYVQNGTLEAIGFDEDELETKGPAVVLEESVHVYPGGAASLSVSKSGSMAYLPPANTSASLDWVDALGRTRRTLELPRGAPSWPRVSPDGIRLAVHVGVPGSRDIWVLDLERPGSSRQVTRGGAEFPVWSPDGNRLAYMTRRRRLSGLYTVAADGSEAPRLVVESPVTKVPLSWSPQDMLAYYAIDSESQRDVAVVDIQADAEPTTFVGTPANELAPVFSPDGRWLAYVSDETGRNEVYVRPFPPPGGVVMVSAGGGSEPVWGRDGSVLYYRNGDAILAVPVSAGSAGRSFEAGTPEVQLETALVPNSAGNPLYDVLPGGRGFIVMRSPAGASIDRVHLVTGFDGALRRAAAF